jgi:thiamine transporter
MSKNIRKLVYCAVCIALSVVTGSLTLFELPNGGAITPFSMLFASLPGFFFGPYWGIFSGIAYGILSFVLKPYFLSVIQVICDYVLAFGALGLTGFFYKKNHGLFMGYTAACIGRFVFAVISGVAFFAD